MITPRFIPSISLSAAVYRSIKVLGRYSTYYPPSYIEQIKKYFGKKYVVLFPQARIALFAIMKTLFDEDSEIIISAYNVPAVIDYLKPSGVILRYVDVEENGFNIDISNIVNAVNKNTKAVLISHMYGQAVDFSELISLCRDKGILIIEDAAQAFGSKIESKNEKLCGRLCGTCGDIGIFSTGIMKKFTTIIGGFVVTDRSELYHDIQKFKNNHCSPSMSRLPIVRDLAENLKIVISSNRYIFNIIFFFFKEYIRNINFDVKKDRAGINPETFSQDFLENYHSCLGIKSFEKFEIIKNIYSQNAVFFEKLMNDPGNEINTDYFNYLHYPVLVNNRKELIKKLNKIGCDAGPGKFCNYGGTECINSEKAVNNHINIPLHPGISHKMFKSIAAIIKIHRI